MLELKDIVLKYTLYNNFFNQNISITFDDIDTFVLTTLRELLVCGIGIGSCFFFGIFLFMINSNRRKKPALILNQAILIVMFLRCLFCTLYLMGPLNNVAFSFTGIFSNNSFSSVVYTIIANVLETVLIALIQTILVYQTYIIFRSPDIKKMRIVLVSFGAVIGVFVVALYFNTLVIVIQQYLNMYRDLEIKEHSSWEFTLPFILFSISISIMSVILIVKLIFALKTRKYLGLKNFDAIHVLVIMLTSTLFIPSILVFLNHFSLLPHEFYLIKISLLSIVLFLPFSSLWASTANNTPHLSSCFSNPMGCLTFPDEKSNSYLGENVYSFFPKNNNKKIMFDFVNCEKSTLAQSSSLNSEIHFIKTIDSKEKF